MNVQERRREAFLSNVVRATKQRGVHILSIRRSGYSSEIGKLSEGDIQRLAKDNGFAVREAVGTKHHRVFHLAINQSA